MSLGHFWSSEGNSPERLLFLKLRLAILRPVMFVLDSLTRQSVIDPLRLFLDRSSSCSDCNLHKEDGMAPEIMLSYRTSFSSSGAPKSDGSGPITLFPLRSKLVRLMGSFGIGPSSWLELKSILTPLINSIVDGRTPEIRLFRILRNSAEEAAIQNQLGTMSFMLVFDISRFDKCVCHLSHIGNVGPSWQDRR